MKEAARFFKILADESRLNMLWLLFNRRELCVCDIMAVLEITQSKASRHLATMRNLGIVTDRREGQWSYYSLCPVEGQLAKDHLKLLKTTLSQRPEADQLLEKLHIWLKEKEKGASCTPDGKRCSAPLKTGGMRPSLAGGTR
ncbi:MAG: metalloregulator ArsR/SmtB family transcription factor [Acidobacteria bacterium]|nr:metalloregulator ArsR/SmtB family transcription factor [Acidobacteriota bacterium]